MWVCGRWTPEEGGAKCGWRHWGRDIDETMQELTREEGADGQARQRGQPRVGGGRVGELPLPRNGCQQGIVGPRGECKEIRLTGDHGLEPTTSNAGVSTSFPFFRQSVCQPRSKSLTL